MKLATVLPECMANKTNKRCDFVLCSLNASLSLDVRGVVCIMQNYHHQNSLGKLAGNLKYN